MNLDIERIEAFHRAENPSSGRALQKAGMCAVANIKRFEEEGLPEGDICYAIDKDQYYAIK